MNKIKNMLNFKTVLFLLAIIGIVAIIKCMPFILEVTVSLPKFRKYIVSQGSLGAVVLIFFQVLQTVIAPIPGEVIQVAGGYIYGVPLGMIYTTAGLLLGAIIAFYFTRSIGACLIEKLLKRKNTQWVIDMMNNKRFAIILFIVFIIPGLPKDFLIYVAGLTPIKPLKFFAILIISRFPWLLASVSIGANLHSHNYLSSIIIVAIVLVALIFGLMCKGKVMSKLSQDKSI